MTAVHFESYTDARTHLKNLLDAAARGRVATVRRDANTTLLVDVDRLRDFLASAVPSHAQVVPEADGWSVFIPGLPVAADGASFDEAVMIAEYPRHRRRRCPRTSCTCCSPVSASTRQRWRP